MTEDMLAQHYNNQTNQNNNDMHSNKIEFSRQVSNIEFSSNQNSEMFIGQNNQATTGARNSVLSNNYNNNKSKSAIQLKPNQTQTPPKGANKKEISTKHMIKSAPAQNIILPVTISFMSSLIYIY